MKQLVAMTIVSLMVLGIGVSSLSASEADTQQQLQVLQSRVAELEARLSQQSSVRDNSELMQEMVSELDVPSFRQAADTAVTAGYDKRFFIKSADDQFKLEFDVRLQLRHTYAMADDGKNDLLSDGTLAANGDGLDSSASGLEIERARLYLRGHVLKDVKYNICFEADDESNNGNYLYTFDLSYSFMPELGVKAGRYKGPFGKQETTGSGRQMFVDRSLANEVFNIDRVSGVELFGQIDMGDVKPNYQVMVFNGLRNNNDGPISNNDNSPGIAARLTVPFSGASAKDFVNESDLEFHDNAVGQIGLSFAYGNDRDEDHFVGGESDSFEVLGKSNIDGRCDIFELGGEVSMIGVDLSVKYQGLSATIEGFYQHVDGDNGEIADEADFGNVNRFGIDGCEMDNYGAYAQAGYFIVPEKFELVSRVSGVFVDSANDSYEYAGGWNYYISGQDLKLSMDLTYIDDLPISNSSPNFLGVQNNSLFLVRTQLQFQF